MTTTDPFNQWYVLRGEEKFGPFEYGAMIRMMQKNELYDYNYVWAPHMEGWTTVSETPEFSRDRLARLIENKTELAREFVKRAPRADVRLPVYGHDSVAFFDGRCLSLSENGALLLLNNPLLLPDQEILLHFRSTENAGAAFNIRAEIVRKNFSRTRINVKSGLHYAVRFKEVSATGQEVIRKTVKEHTKEAI